MPAYFGLIAHAAQRHAHEFAPQGSGDRLAQGGLAHAGGAYEAEDGAAQALGQLGDGQILQDALLGLGQAGVVLVQDLLRLLEVDDVARALGPRQVGHPVEVGPRDGGLRREGHHLLQARDLLHRRGLGRLRHLGVLDGLPEFLDLDCELVLLAQFLLDRLHLLVEVVLLLGLLDLRLDPGVDLSLEVQDLDVRLDQHDQLLEASFRVRQFEQGLPVGGLDDDHGGRLVGEFGGVLDLRQGGQLGRGAARQLAVLLADIQSVAHHGLDLGRELDGILGIGEGRRPVPGGGGELHLAERGAPQALKEDLEGAVRHLEVLDDLDEHAHPVDVVLHGVFDGHVFLGDYDQELVVLLHRGLDGLDRLGPPDGKRQDHMREDDDVAHGQERQARRGLPGIAHGLLAGTILSTRP